MGWNVAQPGQPGIGLSGKFLDNPTVLDIRFRFIPLPDSHLLLIVLGFNVFGEFHSLIIIIGVEQIVAVPHVPELIKFFKNYVVFSEHITVFFRILFP